MSVPNMEMSLLLNFKHWRGIEDSISITLEYVGDMIVNYHYDNNPSRTYSSTHSNFLNNFEPYNEETKKIPILKGSISIGRKDDSNKPRYSLLPTGTINQVVQVLEYGASDKYEVDNWQKIPDARRRFYDATMRHIDAWWSGEIIDIDKDGVKGSQLPHLAHAICCLLFLMWFDNKGE